MRDIILIRLRFTVEIARRITSMWFINSESGLLNCGWIEKKNVFYHNQDQHVHRKYILLLVRKFW